MPKNELVLAVKADYIKNLLKIEKGFVPLSKHVSLNEFIEPQYVMFGSREWLEKDENFLQIIPYCVLQGKDDTALTYVRTGSGGENRLADKWSVGFGGHINLEDIYAFNEEKTVIDLATTVFAANDRELGEEISFKGLKSLTNGDCIRGFIVDLTNPVGRVHLGVLIDCNLNDVGEIVTFDQGIEMKGLVEIEELLDNPTVILEEWSRIALVAKQNNFSLLNLSV